MVLGITTTFFTHEFVGKSNKTANMNKSYVAAKTPINDWLCHSKDNFAYLLISETTINQQTELCTVG